jgi:enolase
MDVAASEFFSAVEYHLESTGEKLSGPALQQMYSDWRSDFPIFSIEDPFAEDDWASWKAMAGEVGQGLQLVGDDLLVTNPLRLRQAISESACNSILIKLNQIGSLSETLDCINLAQQSSFTTIISHRSGETEDISIAHLAVATNAGQIKTGAPCRTDRVAKYNELLRIERALGSSARYAGREVIAGRI